MTPTDEMIESREFENGNEQGIQGVNNEEL